MDNRFTKKILASIHDLYAKGWNTKELANKFVCDRSTITRILNNQVRSIEDRLLNKKRFMERQVKSQPLSKQGKILRCKREKLHNTKLNNKSANNIRKVYYAGIQTQQELAIAYKVNQSTICLLLKGIKWKVCKC